MAPRRRSYLANAASAGGSGSAQPGRLVTVKLRPDQFSPKIVDLTRVGSRRMGKETRLGQEETIKYKKDKFVPVLQRTVARPTAAHENETKVKSVSIEVKLVKIQTEDTDEESTKKGDNVVCQKEPSNGMTTDVCDYTQGLAMTGSGSDVTENEKFDESLGLVLSDSEEGDDTVFTVDNDDDYDEQENDTACNLVEVTKIPRRIELLKSCRRREKFKFGFSKFESRNDTLNLDRFFTCKKLKIKPKRRNIFAINKELGVLKDFDKLTLKPSILIHEEAAENLVNEGADEMQKDTGFGGKLLRRVVKVPPAPVEVINIIDDILEVVFSKFDQTIDLSKRIEAREEDSELCFVPEDQISKSNVFSNSSAVSKDVCGADKNDSSKAMIEGILTQEFRSNLSITELPDKGTETYRSEQPVSTASLGHLACISMKTSVDSHAISHEIPLAPIKYFLQSHSNCAISTSPLMQTPDLKPPFESPEDTLSELLTPACVEFQSYLAKVPELDIEILARLAPSPDVIITEVSVDGENNQMPENSKKLFKASDDSDSDVVLLSDDETELYIIPPVLANWQSEILSQTWQEWPVPTKSIVVQLGLETGLQDDAIRSWFQRRNDQELERAWREFDKC